MRVRHVRIKNFRGIKELDWTLDTRIACLIGPGDSTKSTILDAIELALSPRWNVSFVDADFYQQNVQEPIEIRVTVGDLSNSMKALDKFGDHLRWMRGTKYLEEPAKREEAVITIFLSIDESLEPAWFIQTADDDKRRRVSSADRERLGVIRVGSFVDRHLSWARGSALSRLTDDHDAIKATLAKANRDARDAVAAADLPKLAQAAKQVQEKAATLGVRAESRLQPRMDIRTMLDGSTCLTLHDGNIPARQKGLGSRRLLVTAVQGNEAGAESILVLDELEYGLEPHRQKRLVSSLRESAMTSGQAIFTTHSPYVLQSAKVDEVFITHSADGLTTVQGLPESATSLLRECPEAWLGTRLVVCEGKTELGLWLGLMERAADRPEWLPASYFGAVAILGNGLPATPYRAKQLASLGYRVAIFVDSDKPLGISNEQMAQLGISLFRWEGAMTTDMRVALDLPIPRLKNIVEIAVDRFGDNLVRQHLRSSGPPVVADLEGLWQLDEAGFRPLIGKAAIAGKWFKSFDEAMALGDVVRACGSELPATPTGKLLQALRDWHETDSSG